MRMKLLDDFTSDNITPEELDSLANSIDSIDDSQLECELKKDWDQFDPGETLSKEKINAMFPLEPRSKKSVIFYKVAAAILALVTVSLSIALYHRHKVDEYLAETTFKVSAGIEGPSTMTLPDGTLVQLNARSVLSYNYDFGRTERRVSLSGEGFFDVAKDAERKFIVETQNMEISVHGTKFNVYAYSERSVDEMSLVEGSVEVSAGGNHFLIAPGEKVLYDKSTGSTHLTKTDNTLETAWMKPELVFDGNTLAEVFDTLERRFGITIISDDKIDSSDRYSGSFTDRRIGDIMEILKMHYHFDYTISGNIITLVYNN